MVSPISSRNQSDVSFCQQLFFSKVNQLPEALHTGFAALKATVAIAFGILAVMEINSGNRIGKWMGNRFAAWQIQGGNHAGKHK